jgi:hypothetical protein
MVVNVRNETRKKDRTSSNRRTLEDSTKIKQCKKVEDRNNFPGEKGFLKVLYPIIVVWYWNLNIVWFLVIRYYESQVWA